MSGAKWIWPSIFLFGVVIATDPMSLRTTKLGDTLSFLDSYKILHPTVVNERGDFLSYDVTRHGLMNIHSKRSKRSLQYPTEDRVYYSLRTKGIEMMLNVTKNKQLTSANCATEVWNKYGVIKTLASSATDCHYHGHVVEQRDSVVAISNCLGLHGMVSHLGEEYIIEPVWNHTSTSKTEGHPHIIYKRSSIKHRKYDKETGLKNPQCPTSELSSRRRNKVRRRRRSVSTERYVETLVVADKKTVAYHGQDEIESYILTIMNIVANLYRDATIGNAINVIVTRIILLTEKQPSLKLSHHAGDTLNSFCKWQETIKPSENSVTMKMYGHHDNAILITRYDICFDKDEPCDTLGLAQVSGMCERGRSCSISQDIGLTSGFTIAHEMGHNFGMQHDGSGNDCKSKINNPGYIMSTQLSGLMHPVRWSSCSRQYITDFFDSGQGECLRNVPMMNDYGVSDGLPGQRYNPDQQCRTQFGIHSTQCQEHQKEVCGPLWCSKQNGRCVSNNAPILDGTSCNTSVISNGWCYGGECVEYGSIPSRIDGNWGEWTEWNECSRTCGGGVEKSERHCDKPRPSHGGKFCMGKRKRYRSCNVQDCPKNSEDFRASQCGKFNNVKFRDKYYQWIPFTADQVKPCSLYCQAIGYNFYVEQAIKVVDGTQCYHDTLDICVNGQCMNVGCDRILGSKVTEDRCRKCGGDGSSCKGRRGMVENRLESKVNTYVEVVKIPKGSVHIVISEKKLSNNFLAVKTIDGKFAINGKWSISWPSTYNVAGTKFHYQRTNRKPESLRALGPTTEDITVMVLLQEPNKGIRYEFNEPVEVSNAVPVFSFKWTYTSWSDCTKTCAKGVTRSEVDCVRKDDQSKVSDVYCNSLRKPAVKTRVCNSKPCPPKWSVGSWGKCSRSCGGGYKTRSVFCIQKVDNVEDKSVDENLCLTRRPVNRIRCNEKVCPTKWHTGEWSKCVGKCGSRTRNRTVSCVTSDEKRKLLLSSCPIKLKPPETETCSNEICPKSHWVTGKWSQCDAKCGKGQQTRRVQCKSWTGEESKSCLVQHRPIYLRECKVPCVESNEVCTDINKAGYCNLVLKFKFCKRPYFLKMCCKTCTK